jgi:TonB family protein
MRSSLLIMVATSLLLPSTATEARETRTLTPSSKWVVDYQDQSCRLARSFGKDEQQIHLVMDQFAPGNAFRVTFIGKSFATSNFRKFSKAKLRFGPNETESDLDGFLAQTGELPAFIATGSQLLAPYSETEAQAATGLEILAAREFSVARMPPERERAVTRLELTGLLRFDVILEIGPMDKAMQALRDCSWATVKSWGLDVEQQKNLSRGASTKQSPAAWLSSKDYPRGMLKKNAQAIVNFRLIIDRDGRPANCVIQQSTRPKEFDDVVCQAILKRARFEPALDASGQPVATFMTQTVVFKIE